MVELGMVSNYTVSDIQERIKLDFMIAPDQLTSRCEVPEPVRVVIVDPEAIFLTGLLGESGRKMVEAGLEFIFTRRLAEKLISKDIAKECRS